MPATGLCPSTRARGLQRQGRSACQAAQVHQRLLSLGGRRSTRACSAPASCRAGCGWPVPVRTSLRRREASLLRGAPVMRPASCGLQRQASAACLARRTRACARDLLGEGAALEVAACACRAALIIAGPCVSEEHRTGERRLSFGAPVVRRASCGLQRQASATCLARRRRACARCLGGGGAALERAVLRSCRVRLVVVGLFAKQGHRAGERPFSFGARAWFDVPAATSNAKPAPRVSRGARPPALAVSWEQAYYSSSHLARAVPHWF